MKAPPRIATGARKRIEQSMTQIRASLKAIADGRPGDAESDVRRRTQVYQARTGVPLQEAHARVTQPGEGRERIFGKTVDFVDVAFFERGRRAARAVARIVTRDGAPLGTGFLISPKLLMTNNHVIDSGRAALGLLAEFDYELGIGGTAPKVTRFSFTPQDCFLTNDEDNLDYTVVALGQRVLGSKALVDFGYLPISNARNKHQLGDLVNIIQHPDGRMKEAVVRENQIVSRRDTTLHYVADTEPGSSGSPVLNVQFSLIALHHWGTPHRELTDEHGKLLPKTVNEGIRASSIYNDLATLQATLAPGARALVAQSLQLGLNAARYDGSISDPNSNGNSEGSTQTGLPATAVGSDGSATWNIPLTVTVRIGASAIGNLQSETSVTPGSDGFAAAGAEAKLELDPAYDKRGGYDPDFLGGAPIMLPKLSAAQRKIAARNLQAKSGDDPFELKYHHFSIVMNGKRRLAFVSAVNIDGSQAKDFDRRKGTISDPFEDDEEGQEASEVWFAEERIKPNQQTPPDFYSGQTTFDSRGNRITDRRSQAHLLNLFQQGHLTRRQDPLWGPDPELIKFANSDTFHVTNCSPQIGFFNMGMVKRESIDSGEKENTTKSRGGKKQGHPGGNLHWRALEEYVQTNARADRSKVTVFTGPIFDNTNDYDWTRGRADMRGFKAPREYWKLILRKEKGELQATALLANQTPLVGSRLPENLESRVTYGQVEQYHLSVTELESRTDLDFGKAVRAADTFVPKGTGKERRIRRVEKIQDINLLRRSR
jgi:endonuclease G